MATITAAISATTSKTNSRPLRYRKNGSAVANAKVAISLRAYLLRAMAKLQWMD